MTQDQKDKGKLELVEPARPNSKLKRVEFNFSESELHSLACQVKSPSLPKPIQKSKNSKSSALPYQRVDYIYDKVYHKMRIQDIVKKHGAKYTTVHTILNIFSHSGRIFCLHPTSSKARILRTREQSLQSQAAYRDWRAQRQHGPGLANYRWVDQKKSNEPKNIINDSIDYNDFLRVTNAKAPCGLQLLCDGDNQLRLTKRMTNAKEFEDMPRESHAQFRTEQNFLKVNDLVERNDADLYRKTFGKQGSSSCDLYFTQPLFSMNVPMVKDWWLHTTSGDHLKLPPPSGCFEIGSRKK